MKLRFSLRTLLLVPLLIGVVIVSAYWIPKRQSWQTNYAGYYRGLGIFERPGYFGKNWYRIVVFEGTDGAWEVDFSAPGYNPYRGSYGNGQLREEGMCMVTKTHTHPFDPDRNDVLHGRYYSPGGELLSQVNQGTGKQILCYESGQPAWELVLVNGKRSGLKTWYRNGQLRLTKDFRDGIPYGISSLYHDDGTIKSETIYDDGQLVERKHHNAENQANANSPSSGG